MAGATRKEPAAAGYLLHVRERFGSETPESLISCRDESLGFVLSLLPNLGCGISLRCEEARGTAAHNSVTPAMASAGRLAALVEGRAADAAQQVAGALSPAVGKMSVRFCLARLPACHLGKNG